MADKIESEHLLIAVFILFVVVIGMTIFVPNITAAATAEKQGDGLPVVLLWVLPLLIIISIVVFYSHKAIYASRITG